MFTWSVKASNVTSCVSFQELSVQNQSLIFLHSCWNKLPYLLIHFNTSWLLHIRGSRNKSNEVGSPKSEVRSPKLEVGVGVGSRKSLLATEHFLNCIQNSITALLGMRTFTNFLQSWWSVTNPPPPGGYSSEFSVGVCRPVLQILTLFQS